MAEHGRLRGCSTPHRFSLKTGLYKTLIHTRSTSAWMIRIALASTQSGSISRWWIFIPTRMTFKRGVSKTGAFGLPLK